MRSCALAATVALVMALAEPGAVLAAPAEPGRWEVQTSGVTDDLRDVTFVTDQLGWAVGHRNTILRTTDGGKTWKRLLPRDEKGPDFRDVLFVGPKEGWVKTATYDTILHTTDGGDTWQKVPMPVASAVTVSGYCAHAAVGPAYYLMYWGSAGSRLYRTDDAGKKWVQLTDKLKAGSLGGGDGDLFFLDDKRGWFVIRRNIPTRGFASFTEDGGKTWTEQEFKDDKVAGGNYARVQFADAKTGWFISEFGTIHGSVDGGKTWAPQALGHDAKWTLKDMHFADAKLGHVLCEHVDLPAAVRRTADGGKTWDALPALKAPDLVYGVCFPDRANGWVVGAGGFVARYTAAKE
jgi:photosystem II stability/assembly factor-like uncharacterized protein